MTNVTARYPFSYREVEGISSERNHLSASLHTKARLDAKAFAQSVDTEETKMPFTLYPDRIQGYAYTLSLDYRYQRPKNYGPIVETVIIKRQSS